MFKQGGIHNSPCAPKTIARKLATLSSFYNFLVQKGVYPSNPALSIKRPRREVVTPTQALNSEQVRELFKVLEDNPNKSRYLHRALIISFFTTGLRKNEILNLKFRDYKKN